MNEKQIKAARAMRDVGSTEQQIAETLGVPIEVLREALRGVPKVEPQTDARPGPIAQAAELNARLVRALDVPSRGVGTGWGRSGPDRTG